MTPTALPTPLFGPPDIQTFSDEVTVAHGHAAVGWDRRVLFAVSEGSDVDQASLGDIPIRSSRCRHLCRAQTTTSSFPTVPPICPAAKVADSLMGRRCLTSNTPTGLRRRGDSCLRRQRRGPWNRTRLRRWSIQLRRSSTTLLIIANRWR